MTGEMHIGELVLRIPGISAAEAYRVVDDVLARIRAGLPAGTQPVTLDHVDVRVPLPRGLGRDALAERIARAVLDQLHPGGRRG